MSRQPDERLSEQRVQEVLARATRLDLRRESGLTVAELKAAANEAGISPESIDAALDDLSRLRAEASPSTWAPWWKRWLGRTTSAGAGVVTGTVTAAAAGALAGPFTPAEWLIVSTPIDALPGLTVLAALLLASAPAVARRWGQVEFQMRNALAWIGLAAGWALMVPVLEGPITELVIMSGAATGVAGGIAAWVGARLPFRYSPAVRTPT